MNLPPVSLPEGMPYSWRPSKKYGFFPLRPRSPAQHPEFQHGGGWNREQSETSSDSRSLGDFMVEDIGQIWRLAFCKTVKTEFLDWLIRYPQAFTALISLRPPAILNTNCLVYRDSPDDCNPQYIGFGKCPVLGILNFEHFTKTNICWRLYPQW